MISSFHGRNQCKSETNQALQLTKHTFDCCPLDGEWDYDTTKKCAHAAYKQLKELKTIKHPLIGQEIKITRRTCGDGKDRRLSFGNSSAKSTYPIPEAFDDLCGNLISEYFCWMLGDPHFFFGRSLRFLILSIILKNKKISVWEVLIISHILFK